MAMTRLNHEFCRAESRRPIKTTVMLASLPVCDPERRPRPATRNAAIAQVIVNAGVVSSIIKAGWYSKAGSSFSR